MSSDLFAAFGEASPAKNAYANSSAPEIDDPWNAAPGQLFGNGSADTKPSDPPLAHQDEEEDDFGDFEDANAPQLQLVKTSSKPQSTSHPAASSDPQPKQKSAPFPAKAPKKPEPQVQDPKVGRHPFAGHMDFLFDGDDDEYDAGADDLDNLANNPVAAMAYSKRLIAEQQAQSKTSQSSAHATPTGTNEVLGQYKTPSTKSHSTSNHTRADSHGKTGKLTKSPPKSHTKTPTQGNSNPPPARNKLKKKSGYAPARDPNVLFDADDPSEADDDDDDFGDFESGPTISISNVVSPSAAQKESEVSMPNMDLLGLEEPVRPKSLGQVGRTRSASLRAADQILGPPKHSPSNSMSHNEGNLIDDNPWADFEAEPPKPFQSGAAPSSAITGAEDDTWDDFEEAEPQDKPPFDIPVSAANASSGIAAPRLAPATESLVPPTNIPPPVLLLSIFPTIFSSAQDALFAPLSRLDTAQRQELLSHHASHQFLRSYLNSAMTLAHIIAGRKLRWKRDQILSQSMRIGPAAAGGKGGMKLTGVDKSEVAKEEREVLDAVRSWKGQAGKLRGAVSTAASSSRDSVKFPPVPDISETMPVKTLKSIEGGFVAPHPCALCGLKREERVQKVDIDIDDSFGEWWVNGMDMHVTCKTWWEENRAKLRSR